MYTLHNTIKISDLRKKTAEVIEEIAGSSEPVYVFSRSEPKVVMMSCKVFEGAQEAVDEGEVKNGKRKKPAVTSEKRGIDFFIDPPEEILFKKKGLDAIKIIRAERD